MTSSDPVDTSTPAAPAPPDGRPGPTTTQLGGEPGLQALTAAAIEATGSAAGWVLLDAGDGFTVVAAAGPSAEPVERFRARTGTAGMVAATGQPAALLPGADVSNAGAAGLPGIPGALLVAPCLAGTVVGVLELARTEPEPYSFDDLELAALLAEIAGALLENRHVDHDPVPGPDAVHSDLRRLATTEPERYRDIVRTLTWMLQ